MGLCMSCVPVEKFDRKQFEGIVRNLLTQASEAGRCENQQEEALEVNPAADVIARLIYLVYTLKPQSFR